ncbi:hypothetical protein G7Y89_g14284 [Cudoniella acicularis]|uniref:sterol 22-desaturase n=1 Tax=Cudoniella acicularis TaxID=354080 RepID=A0A8H4R3S8_9HELO|nr:hypothetical protein G7Y89_g14284 [Cudoniella acicularis]
MLPLQEGEQNLSPTTDQASYKSVTYTSPRLLTSHNATEGASDVLALPMVVAAGFLDPFDSYPQTNLPRLRVQGLIHHFLSKIAFAYYPLDLDSKSNPFVVSWWPLALKDPALFHVSLQTASLDDELLAQNGFPDSNVLMAESVSLVRRKVQDPSLAFQDETMDAVVTLAAIEYGKGELHTSKMHIDGVIRMVAVRGGIQAVKKSSPLTARMVPWVSMLVMGIPQFPTQDDAGHGDGISTIQLWKDSSFTPTLNQELVNLGGLGLEPELFDTLLRLRNIFYRFSIRDSQHTELPTTDLHDLTYYLRRLVLFKLEIFMRKQSDMYRKNKGSLPGPNFKLPFMGPFLQSLDPKFEGYEAQWARGPMSCVSVFHKFVVLVSDRDLARRTFQSTQYVKPCLVAVAEYIMGPTAWVFLNGKSHVDFRKGLTGLFTPKALNSYLPIQEKVYFDYFNKFVATSDANGGKPLPYMGHFRELNCALSCRTFVGDYISDKAVKKIADDYYCITSALELINIPFSQHIPFSKVWKGKRAANVVLDEFTKCAAASKIHMATGEKPSCVLDQWVANMIESKEYLGKVEAGDKGAEKPSVLLREFTDFEIATTLFTFLFASQDASSSTVTWLFQIMAQRPDILDRVREENLEARGGDKSKTLDLENLESLVYTNAVVREVLRYRPPVIFVPYLAKKAFPVTPTYTVPKGAMIIPSCYPALHDPEAYPRPDYFDPERWISGDAHEKTKNWLVFGAGPHQCIAQQYVQLTITAMIGTASLEVDWTHYPTSRSEEIKVFATLFPMDDCPLVFKKRV